ncbi:hypothetical protein EZS27_020521 [termite gut metagenome]|uniref:Uncharacterized protein n=1 Tax=termite gut metagenome TaxID=433724 RepID=A0A5J4R9S2_9ZZZZ
MYYLMAGWYKYCKAVIEAILANTRVKISVTSLREGVAKILEGVQKVHFQNIIILVIS